MRSIRLLSFLVLAITASQAGAAIKIVAGPYLQTPTETSVTVMWITDVASTAEVEFGLTDSLGKKAVSTHDGQIDANSTIHRVTIKGLKPDTKYNYKVTSTEIIKYEPYKVTFGEKIVSSAHTFTTLDTNKTDCSFVVFNDIHDDVKTLKGLVAMANEKPYEMIFLNGDIINDPGSEPQIINNLLKPATDLFASDIPFILARGNHEIRGAYSRLLKNYVDTPQDRFYFSFQHGPVYFIVMDCGEDKEDSHWAYSGLNDFEGYRNEQAEWLKKEIEKPEFKNAPFRVAITHIPLFGSGDAFGTTQCRNKWAALLNKGKIDLHISGHTHRPNVLNPEPDVHDYPIFIGGAPQEKRFTVIRVDATKEALNVTMTKDGGEVIGSAVIK